MCSVTNFFPIYQERSQEKKVSMPLSNENFIFFSAPDLDVHEPSISYVKSCRALWKQGNTSTIGRDQRNIYNQDSIEATPEVLTLEVSSIL